MIEDAALALLVPVVAIFGLLIGSFLNVVVWRVPRGESVVRPPSACPGCGAHIRGFDNIPVVSWLVLRGRCRDCRAPISPRYPAVEAATAIAFGLLAWWVGASWTLPVLLFLAAITICLTLIDLDVQRLPDAIVLPSYPTVLVLLVLASWAPGAAADWSALWRSLAAGGAMFLAYFLMRFAYPRGMGFGDVKLAGVLGLVLGWWGWSAVVVGFFAAFLLGGIFSISLILAGKASRASKVPFGPWMLAGAWVGLLAGQRLVDAYLGLVGL